MSRKLVTPLTMMLLILVAITYNEKNAGQKSLKKLASLRHELKLESDKKILLETDLALLTQPQRLQALAKAHNYKLQLAPIEPKQILPLASFLSVDDLLNNALGLNKGFAKTEFAAKGPVTLRVARKNGR